jgi:putative glycosyltransferase (TIGR04348 family)
VVNPRIGIVTPATAQDNTGNWHTARRWAQMLRQAYRVDLWQTWPGDAVDLLLVLHARRGAAALAAFRDRYPNRPVILTLTGTDLYKDLPAGDTDTRRSLAAANQLIVLQADALEHLPADCRARAHIVHQSANGLTNRAPDAGPLRLVAVGHLRSEKDPTTVFRALRQIPRDIDFRFRHLGRALDPTLGSAAAQLAAADPRYRWLGNQPRGVARQAIQSAHLLVHPSIMEGGAQVVIEAVTSGTGVIASRMSGNIGLLGPEHPGYFPVADAEALAHQIARAALEPAYRAQLMQASRARADRFSPRQERISLHAVVNHALLGASNRIHRP